MLQVRYRFEIFFTEVIVDRGLVFSFSNPHTEPSCYTFINITEWSGEVRNITYSVDGKSVSVVYRVTIYGTDAEVFFPIYAC